MTIHWCGTGLSSGPGLRRLIAAGQPVVVWNRTVETAREMVGDLTDDIRAYSLEALSAALAPGDVAVSMLPGDHHLGIAKACLENGAHFVSSSYISPEIRALDAAFRDKGLTCMNECGLDPGIDHLMAHDLVARYRADRGLRRRERAELSQLLRRDSEDPQRLPLQVQLGAGGGLKALRSPSRSREEFHRVEGRSAVGCDHQL